MLLMSVDNSSKSPTQLRLTESQFKHNYFFSMTNTNTAMSSRKALRLITSSNVMQPNAQMSVLLLKYRLSQMSSGALYPTVSLDWVDAYIRDDSSVANPKSAIFHNPVACEYNT